ncbi:hypothetical protein [Ottowia sp.]|uniref:hypothetical protein n=1 Tax=Ottowia sp. TaxID=1898956 RepID=UPI0025E5AFB2|nr:hypothetical protein [Ottowia sp.]MBK6616625.1 hypothetical protein [Ottowia sp.]
MKRKIVVLAEVIPGNDLVDIEVVRASLQGLGEVHITVLEEVALTSRSSPELTQPFWFYVRADEELPYLVVGGPGEIEGTVPSSELVDELQEHGVCTEFHAHYPRGDRYGVPLYASEPMLAEARVAEHFIAAAEGLEIVCKDRRDDGTEEIWLKVMGRAK